MNDAERYRWLRRNASVEVGTKDIHLVGGPTVRAWTLTIFVPVDENPDDVGGAWGRRLTDAAVDAAAKT